MTCGISSNYKKVILSSISRLHFFTSICFWIGDPNFCFIFLEEPYHMRYLLMMHIIMIARASGKLLGRCASKYSGSIPHISPCPYTIPVSNFQLSMKPSRGKFPITNPRLYVPAQVTMIQILQGIHHGTKELETTTEDYLKIDKDFINC